MTNVILIIAIAITNIYLQPSKEEVYPQPLKGELSKSV